LQPDFVVTTGDNNYLTASQYDRAVGKYYSSYLGNYSGSFGSGSSSNRFFPIIGNHDWFSDNYAAYLNYFSLPGNERYYQFTRGPISFFMLNSDEHEVDGVSSSSRQAMWLSNSLRQASSPWKVVVLHHPPYSSAASSSTFRWPFAQWGAHVVMAGHSHNYERIHRDGIVYYVNGVGGGSLAAIGSPIEGSAYREDEYYGAMMGRADEGSLTLEFYAANQANAPQDSYTLNKPGPVSFPRLGISRSGTNIVLGWPAEFTGYKLQNGPAIAATNWMDLPHETVGTQNVARVGIGAVVSFFRWIR
jgi:tartrate-resistant acid phosphatase type 5